MAAPILLSSARASHRCTLYLPSKFEVSSLFRYSVPCVSQQLRWKSETHENKEGKIPSREEVKRDLFENLLAEYHVAPTQPHKGQIYDKKPFKFPVQEGKIYIWCACGHSKSQPFCDKSHHFPHLKVKVQPVLYKAPKSRDIWFCNCKQTQHPPFCDGTHKSLDVEEVVKS
ncbi:unnamed protein product [Darwinula stevensoni]|uniref:Iron-binding zinc finger CDGSH type domain-containing protein n=1 Tax=Darwinula stevensoni TaxID=69355 RepID=A0A7R9AA47_9CRUS|nr:unnamed protein product [Darwinula stevensoni]CAG0898070.1 unnamed protein product [Darwinula stevensoni]